MSYFAGSYRQLLFGVSQQVAKDRLEGQVEIQENMTSDVVTGPRRRAPVRAIAEVAAYTDSSRIAQDKTNIGGRDATVLVNAVTGQVTVVADDTGAVLFSGINTYLIAPAGKNIRLTTLGDAVFLLNTTVKPTSAAWAGASGLPDPEKTGYIYVVAGGFSKQYNLTVTNRDTNVTTTVTHTTHATDAAQAQPEYIITQLRTAAQANANIGTGAGVVYAQTGAYLYISAPFRITVSTDSGSQYIRASNASSIRDVSELPARLDDTANGYIVDVGASETKTYYRWESSTKRWVEDASKPAQVVLTNMPIQLTVTLGVYSLVVPTYERRASGDDTTNPLLRFTEYGITGMASLQGRLVLLANEYVCMSGSDKPLRWFRSTVSSVLASDPIEVAGTPSVSSPYEYGVQFNKDLVLFARTHQGIVPGSGVITPSNAVVGVATGYTFQTSCSPVVTGRTVFFPAPRSQGYSGVWEMVPSQYTDAQLQADDVTSHIPRYIFGDIRFLAASTTTNIVVAGTGVQNELIVHEYLWTGAEKAHAAWHRWTFAHPVLGAYFVGDRLVLLFGVAGQMVLASVDLREGAGPTSAQTARLDFGQSATCSVAGELTIPTWVYNLRGSAPLWVFKTSGVGAFLPQTPTAAVGSGSNTVLSVVDAEVGDVYSLGTKFTSVLSPTRPINKDRNGVPITTERTQLHSMVFSFASTGEITITISDAARTPFEYVTTPLRMFSQELGAGQPLAASAQVKVPCRVDMQSASVVVETDDVYDLNITSLEYGFRYNQRYRR